MYMLPNRGAVTVYRVADLGMLVFGATSSVPLVWELADFFNGIMASLNLVGLLFLSGVVVKAMKDYETKFRAGDENPGIDAETLSGFSRR